MGLEFLIGSHNLVCYWVSVGILPNVDGHTNSMSPERQPKPMSGGAVDPGLENARTQQIVTDDTSRNEVRTTRRRTIAQRKKI
jgi:hypothetical protein